MKQEFRKYSKIGIFEIKLLDDAYEPYPENPPERWFEPITDIKIYENNNIFS